ncbi:hypothetical protein Wxf_00036 [Armadillidium vulgare]|nr:hypothetical protein Wxf_00036 [Armadillidium vulgare] [Wolbachia endosymbiont of Armadillidium vulgare]
MDFETNKLQNYVTNLLSDFFDKESITEKREQNLFRGEINSIFKTFADSSEQDEIIKEIDLEKERVRNRKKFLEIFYDNPPSDDLSLAKESIRVIQRPNKIIFNIFTEYLCMMEDPGVFCNYLFKMLIPLNPKSSFELKDSYATKNITGMSGEGDEFGNLYTSFVAKNCKNRKIIFTFIHSNVFKNGSNDAGYSIGCVYPENFRDLNDKSKKEEEEGNVVDVFSEVDVADGDKGDNNNNNGDNDVSHKKKKSLSDWKIRMRAASGIPPSSSSSSNGTFSPSEKFLGKIKTKNSDTTGFSSSFAHRGDKNNDNNNKNNFTADGGSDDDDDDVDGDDEESDYRRYLEAKSNDGGNNNDYLFNYCLAKRAKYLQILPRGTKFCRIAYVINYLIICEDKCLDIYDGGLKLEVEKIVRDLANKDIFASYSRNDEMAMGEAILTAIEGMGLSRDLFQDEFERRMLRFIWSVLTCRKESNIIYLLNVIIHVILGKFFLDPHINENSSSSSSKNRINKKKLKTIPNSPNFIMRKNRDVATLKIRAYCGPGCDKCFRGYHKSHQFKTTTTTTTSSSSSASTSIEGKKLKSRDTFTKMKEYKLDDKYGNDCFIRSIFHTFFCPRINFIASFDSRVRTFVKDLVYLFGYDDKRAYKYKLKKNGKQLLRQEMDNDPAKGDVFVKRSCDEIIAKAKELGLDAHEVMVAYMESCEKLSGFRKKTKEENKAFRKGQLQISKMFFSNVEDVKSVQGVVTKQNSLRIHRILSGISNFDSMSGSLEGFFVSIKNDRSVEIFSSNVNIFILNADMSAINTENEDHGSFSVGNLMSNTSFREKLEKLSREDEEEEEEDDDDDEEGEDEDDGEATKKRKRVKEEYRNNNNNGLKNQKRTRIDDKILKNNLFGSSFITAMNEEHYLEEEEKVSNLFENQNIETFD